MTKPSNLSLIILLAFFSLAHGQDASVVPSAKGSEGSSGQQDENKAGQQVSGETRYPLTVYGPHQHFEIDQADPPHAVAAQGRLCNLSETRNKWYSTTHVSGLLQMYSRSGRLLWTIPCRCMGCSHSREQSIAIDSARQRIYIRECAAGKIEGRTSAFDFHGNRLWSIPFEGHLMLNLATGNLWVGQFRHTLVVDVNGKVLGLGSGSTAMFYDTKSKSVRKLVWHSPPLRQLSVVFDKDDDSRWVCESSVRGEIQPPWTNNFIKHVSANGKLLSKTAREGSEIDLIEPGKPGQLIVHSINKTEFFDKKTLTFEEFRGRCFATADESSIWIQDKDGVSAVDFDGKELFSVGIKGPRDWETEMHKSETLAGEIAARLPADDPRVLRSQQVVEDWKLFIKGMDFSIDKHPFGSLVSDALNLRLIRD